jgi:hypothetical protein
MWQAVARRWPGTTEARLAPGEMVRIQAQIEAAKLAKDPAAEMPVELPPTATVKPEQLADQLQDEG